MASGNDVCNGSAAAHAASSVITVTHGHKDHGQGQQHNRQQQSQERQGSGGGGRSRSGSGSGSAGDRMASGGGADGKLTVGRLSLVSLAADILIILAIGVTILLLTLFGEPFRRGFFCDDDAIRLPWKRDTVSTALLLCVGVALPLLAVAACEGVAARRQGPAGRARRVAVARGSVKAWVARALWTLTLFFFGLAVQDVIVEAGKFSVGRLRPHFLDACRPSPSVTALCGGNRSSLQGVFASSSSSFPPDRHVYVEDYVCTGDEDLVKQARLSFPSGHSSLAFYSAVFTVLYLQRRFRWKRRARLQLGFLQLVVVLLAWLTALSRVADHKHHWSDVLAGGALGAAVAVLTVLVAVLPSSSSSSSHSAGGGHRVLVLYEDVDDEDGTLGGARGEGGPEGVNGGCGLRSTPSCDTYETLFVI